MDLSEVRVDIDVIDKQMRELFIKRMSLAKEVAEIKGRTNDDVYKPDRERQMIGELSGDVPEVIKEEYIEYLTNLLKLSRRYQYRLLGIPESEWK